MEERGEWTRWIKINEFEIQSENFYWTRNLCGAKAKTAQSICFSCFSPTSLLRSACACVCVCVFDLHLVWQMLYTFGERWTAKQHFQMYRIHFRFRFHTHAADDAVAAEWRNWNTYQRMGLHCVDEDETCKCTVWSFCCAIMHSQWTTSQPMLWSFIPLQCVYDESVVPSETNISFCEWHRILIDWIPFGKVWCFVIFNSDAFLALVESIIYFLATQIINWATLVELIKNLLKQI